MNIVIATLSLGFVSLFLYVIATHDSPPARDAVRTSAVSLLRSCKGEIEILQSSNGALLISCAPAASEQPKKKEPTKGDDV